MEIKHNKNLWDKVKAVIRVKLVSINTYIIKKKVSINITPQRTKKKEQIKLKVKRGMK
jgi:hypothetical protein